uniref:Uncharacterized protein n=1 Tax=Anguilla anguilla TaxID=7936 RepID=A0A0E9UL63_ANGAN
MGRFIILPLYSLFVILAQTISSLKYIEIVTAIAVTAS